MFDPLLSEKEELGNVVTVLACLAPSPAILMYVTRPDLFAKYDAVHLVLLLTGIGFGVLLGCATAVDFVTASADSRTQRISRRDSKPIPKKAEKKYWSMLSTSAGLANVLILSLSAWAYWHPLRLGATLVASVIVVVLLTLPAVLINALVPINWTNPRRGQNAGSTDNDTG